jgi:urease accessory protein
MTGLPRISIAASALVLSTTAFAHTGHEAASFTSGLLHPLTGFDHLLAMLAVGVWSGLTRGPVWLAPLAFMVMLGVGAGAGATSIAPAGVEPMIAASLLVLGLLIVWAHRLPMAAGALAAGGFALFHGAAHGAEVGATTFALLGMLMATAALHLTGLTLGRHVIARRLWVPRASGALLALSGVGLLLRLA